MVAIKDMKMPKSCWNCDFCYEIDGFHCSISHNCLAKKVTDLPNKNRPSDCPLVEIVTCKDCKHCYPDEDGRGYHCERDSNVRFSVHGYFWCSDGKRRE